MQSGPCLRSRTVARHSLEGSDFSLIRLSEEQIVEITHTCHTQVAMYLNASKQDRLSTLSQSFSLDYDIKQVPIRP
jgi:hypothetical protein